MFLCSQYGCSAVDRFIKRKHSESHQCCFTWSPPRSFRFPVSKNLVKTSGFALPLGRCQNGALKGRTILWQPCASWSSGSDWTAGGLECHCWFEDPWSTCQWSWPRTFHPFRSFALPWSWPPWWCKKKPCLGFWLMCKMLSGNSAKCFMCYTPFIHLCINSLLFLASLLGNRWGDARKLLPWPKTILNGKETAFREHVFAVMARDGALGLQWFSWMVFQKGRGGHSRAWSSSNHGDWYGYRQGKGQTGGFYSNPHRESESLALHLLDKLCRSDSTSRDRIRRERSRDRRSDRSCSREKEDRHVAELRELRAYRNIMKPWKKQKQKKNAKTPKTRKGSKSWPTSKPASYGASQHKSLQPLWRKHRIRESLMFCLQRPRNLWKHSWRMKFVVRMSARGMTWNAKWRVWQVLSWAVFTVWGCPRFPCLGPTLPRLLRSLHM